MIRQRDLHPAAPLHLAALAWVAGMLVFAARAPEAYAAAMREDGVVEWLTASLFAAAGFWRLRAAIRARRPLDLLVALFCLFVAGEEISWGQRLFGITPPAPFLEQNTQQELNLHNFADVFGKPKWILALALAAFGAVLPLAARVRPLSGPLERAGGTPPSLHAAAWFCAGAALLVWYPVEFTGEWTECLAGALFLVSANLSARTVVVSAAGALAVAVTLTTLGARPGVAADARQDCARLEVEALVAAVTEDGMATDELASKRGTVHKRLWSAAEEGYVDLEAAVRYRDVRCPGMHADDASDRRRYGVDPWGMAYWIRTGPAVGGQRAVAVYSFGPNRRRDSGAGARGGGAERSDDVIAAGSLRVP